MTTTEITVAAAEHAVPGHGSPATVKHWKLLAARIAVPVVVLVAWQVIAPLTTLVPPPAATFAALVDGFTQGWVYAGLAATASAIAVGFLIGAITAFLLGYLMGRSATLTSVFEPVVAGTFAVPRVVLYPVLLAVFGVGMRAEAWMVGISAFFPILMSTAAAVRNVSPALLKLGRSLNANRLQIARKIVIPDAAPGIMVGLRIGFSISLVAAIIAELFAAKDGIGLMISDAYGQLNLPRMYALVLLVMLGAFAGNMLLWWAERWLRQG